MSKRNMIAIAITIAPDAILCLVSLGKFRAPSCFHLFHIHYILIFFTRFPSSLFPTMQEQQIPFQRNRGSSRRYLYGSHLTTSSHYPSGVFHQSISCNMAPWWHVQTRDTACRQICVSFLPLLPWWCFRFGFQRIRLHSTLARSKSRFQVPMELPRTGFGFRYQ